MSKYVKHNQNPFGKVIGDCVVRSLSLGLGIPYEKICDDMGKGFKDGEGLIGDITLNDISDFSKKTGMLKPLKFDNAFFDYVYRGKDYEPKYTWPTLRDFANGNRGKYIVLVRRSDVDMTHEYAREVFKITFHVIYVNGDRKEYYDNMNNDPGDMTIYGVFRIKS